MAGIMDWLDVLTSTKIDGAARISEVLAGTDGRLVPPPAPDEGTNAQGEGEQSQEDGTTGGGTSDGDDGGHAGRVKAPPLPEDGRELPLDDVLQARIYIEDNWAAPMAERRDTMKAAHRLVAVLGEGEKGGPCLFRWTGSGWEEMHWEELLERIGTWLTNESFYTLNKGTAKTGPSWKRAVVSPKAKEAIAKSVVRQVMAKPPETMGVPAEAFWRPVDYTRDREPIWGRPDWETRLDPELAKVEGLPDVARLVCLRSCVLDIEAWDRGDVRTLEHSPRLVTRTRLDHAVEPEDLDAAAEVAGLVDSAEEIEQHEAAVALLERYSPAYLRVMKHCWGAERDERMFREYFREWLKWIGYVLLDERHHQFGNVIAFTGPSGHGKGTVFSPIKPLLGDLAVPFDFGQLADDRYVVELRRAHIAFNEEAKVGQKDDADRSLATLLLLTGGGHRSTRRLYAMKTSRRIPLAARYALMFKSVPDLKGAQDLRRRMLLLDFPYPVEKSDETLEEAVVKPRSIVGVLLAGLVGRRWLKLDGQFRRPSSSELAEAVFGNKTELLPDEFVEEWLVIEEPGAKGSDGRPVYTTTDDLADAVRAYLMQEKRMRNEMSRQSAISMLKTLLQKNGWRGNLAQFTDDTGKRPRAWTLVRLSAKGRDGVSDYRHPKGAGYGQRESDGMLPPV